MTEYKLKLFITGQTPRSRMAVENLRNLCDHHLGERYSLHVIDVLERPEDAEEAKVLATPLLIKEAPQPVCRIIGDLSDTSRVIEFLEIPQAPARTNGGAKR